MANLTTAAGRCFSRWRGSNLAATAQWTPPDAPAQ